MIDFHSHILPGIDDGSDSVETSLSMLRMEAEQGVRKVVATPHFYARYQSPEEFLRKREASEKALRKAMAGEKDLPELCVGAEVYFFRGISESEFLPKMAIKGTNCVMIEMPPAPWEEAIYRELIRIREKTGLIPVIAHMDRYIGPFRTFRIPEHLAELPVLVQANGDFFLNRPTAGLAMKLVKRGQIHLLGSDCHNLSSRKPNVGLAMEQILRKLGHGIQEKFARYEAIVFEF